jgi:hypothetical protein
MVAAPQQKFELNTTAELRSRFARRRKFIPGYPLDKAYRNPTKMSLVWHGVWLFAMLCIFFTEQKLFSAFWILGGLGMLGFVFRLIRFFKLRNR